LVVASCRVFFHDHRGIEHAIYLEAENRYVAFGLALHKFKQSSCCHPDYRDVQQLNVHVIDGYRVKYRIRVTREQIERWLGPPKPASLDRTRKYLNMLLGRMPPDRDFKNGFRH
jgi:hypothetical protein